MPEPGPVQELAEALGARDLPRIAALLSPGVELLVPPLRYGVRGADAVLGALARLVTAFGELGYDVRSRYLAPGSVTDEAFLVGRQTAYFLGSRPPEGPTRVPVRVIADHDAATVTRLTVWPDVAALGTALPGLRLFADPARTVDDVTATLRATLPPREPRVIVGETRTPGPILPPSPGPASGPAPCDPGDTEVLLARSVPKPPVPKTVRQRRAVLAGGSMLIATGVLATWVTVGVMNVPRGATAPGVAMSDVAAPSGRSADAPDAPPTVPGTRSAPGTSGKVAAPPASQLAAGHDTVVMSSDLLFDTNSDKLTPTARRELAALIAQAHREHRPGTIVVLGYTDDRGGDGYNLKLSARRAAAVAAVLRTGMTGHETKVVSRGHGEKDPVGSNATDPGRQANRRVTVAFPPTARQAVNPPERAVTASSRPGASSRRGASAERPRKASSHAGRGREEPRRRGRGRPNG